MNLLLSQKLTNTVSNECAINYGNLINSVDYKESNFVTDDSNVSKDIISVCGVTLQKHFKSIPSSQKFDLVTVSSTQCNLFKIALGIASNKAICLQGPVGSGKTTLIEYLAHKTGHILGENFVKIQLGDQTDSKMLLGTYRCTDIPGEFIWQPGVLTQVCFDFYYALKTLIRVRIFNPYVRKNK